VAFDGLKCSFTRYLLYNKIKFYLAILSTYELVSVDNLSEQDHAINIWFKLDTFSESDTNFGDILKKVVYSMAFVSNILLFSLFILLVITHETKGM
jgi:hypothetical protein